MTVDYPTFLVLTIIYDSKNLDMKKKLEQLSEQQRIETLDILYTAAGSLRGRDSTKAFLKELLTPSERIMLGRRIWIARLLLSGHTHAEIGKKLEVGPNTCKSGKVAV